MNNRTLPYRLLVTLLYGKMKWLARSDYNVTAPTARLSSHLKTRAGRLRQYVYDLEDMGLVRSAKFNPNWVQVQLRVPEGMDWANPKTEIIDV